MAGLVAPGDTQGLPIGSGVTEVACKIVFTQRLKQSSMSWDIDGGRLVVDLRGLCLSGIWSMVYRAYQRSHQQPKVITGGVIAVRKRNATELPRNNGQGSDGTH